MRNELKADLALLFVVISWGSSNYLISLCEQEMGPHCLNSLRFLVATLTVCLLGYKQLKQMNLTTLKYGFYMGIFLTGNYFFTNTGIMYTTLSNAGFFCGLCVMLIPLGEWAFFGKKPDRKLFIVIVMAVVGIFLMSVKGDFSINTSHIKGDLLCIGCAVSYTFNVLVVDKAQLDERTNSFNLGALQIGFTFLFSSLLACSFDKLVLPQSTSVTLSILFLGVICTGLAFVIQPIAQQYTTGTKVGLIFSLEPVFCAIIAFFFAGEVLDLPNYIGMALLLAGVIILEVDWQQLFRKNCSKQ